nr:hypothetical protein [Tanacetum cinerariifolium]
DLEQESKKNPLEILKIKKEQAEKQKMPKLTIKSTYKATLKEFDLKSALYQTMHANKSFNRNPASHKLYHALMEDLIEDENDMDKGVADTIKDHKRNHDDDEDDDNEDPLPSTTKETPKGKAPSKDSKTGKSVLENEPVEEPIAEVDIDDTGDDVNKHQVVLDQLEQPWLNQMVSAIEDPLTFNDFMDTLIDFSKPRGKELKIQSLQRSHPPPKKPLKVKLHLKTLKLEKRLRAIEKSYSTQRREEASEKKG